MMRAIHYSGSFKRDYKREKRTDPALDEALQPIIQSLSSDAELPKRLSDHALTGEWKGCRDCHIKPDLVLIYEKTEGVLSLLRLGSHSELF